MVVKIILHNLNDDTFVIANSKSNKLSIKENKLYVHIKHGTLIEGMELIEEFDTKNECIEVYEKINKFLNERKSIRETINLTLKDIKKTKDINQKELLEKFLWIMESKFLKYDKLYVRDII
ncbi:TPA: hypothetical protein LA462_000287 [Clostridium botulinum]|nr:hypothetical protein [Clostridium botulinum]